jgi:hypothetical protein
MVAMLDAKFPRRMRSRFCLGTLLVLLSAASLSAYCPVPASQPWYMHQPDCPMYQNALAERMSDGEKVLNTAKQITGEYDESKGLKVSDGANGKFNCTTYMETVLRRGGFDVTSEMSKQINIRLGDDSNLASLLKQGDPRMTGVVGALVDSGQGTMIRNRNQCRVGDLLQMWAVKKDGTSAEGHTGIIEGTNGNTFVLWGAHKGLGKVGEKEYSFGDWGHVWCVRPKKK